MLAVGGDGAILRDATTRQEVRRCPYSLWMRGLHTTHSVAWSADCKVLAASSPTEEAIRVWDRQPAGRQVIATPQIPISAVALSPDGAMVAAGSYRAEGIIRLWSAVTGKPLRPIATPSGIVYAVTFSPDGSVLASSGSEGEIRFGIRRRAGCCVAGVHRAPCPIL